MFFLENDSAASFVGALAAALAFSLGSAQAMSSRATLSEPALALDLGGAFQQRQQNLRQTEPARRTELQFIGLDLSWRPRDLWRFHLGTAFETKQDSAAFVLEKAYLQFSGLSSVGDPTGLKSSFAVGQMHLPIGFTAAEEYQFSQRPALLVDLFGRTKAVDLGATLRYWPVANIPLGIEASLFSGQVLLPSEGHLMPANETPWVTSLLWQPRGYRMFLTYLGREAYGEPTVRALGLGAASPNLWLWGKLKLKSQMEFWLKHDVIPEANGTRQEAMAMYLSPELQWESFFVSYWLGWWQKKIEPEAQVTDLTSIAKTGWRVRDTVTLEGEWTQRGQRLASTGQSLQETFALRLLFGFRFDAGQGPN